MVSKTAKKGSNGQAMESKMPADSEHGKLLKHLWNSMPEGREKNELTAKKLREKYPIFAQYQYNTINSAIQSLKRSSKRVKENRKAAATTGCKYYRKNASCVFCRTA